MAGCHVSLARGQRLAQLDVVEDLAVERHPQRAVGRREGLAAAREIDDREAAMPQAAAAVQVDAGIVGSAVAHRVDHALEHLAPGQQARREREIAGDPAHGKRQVIRRVGLWPARASSSIGPD
jgi:hypothetical protein